mgnify:CR=1 FL=1
MAQKQAVVSGGNLGGRRVGPGASRGGPVGLLDSIRNVSNGVSVQRGALESAYDASKQSTLDAARKVFELDARLARASANQAVLQARRDSLDSVARRKLRANIWGALSQDMALLKAHNGRRRLAVAWVVSVTADDERNWSADVWLPVPAPVSGDGPPLALWEAAVEACSNAMKRLHGGGPGPEVVTAHGLLGLRVTPGRGCSRDDLKAALVRAMDRTRVQAVPLHQLRVEVSVVWLDVAVTLDGPPTRLSGMAPEDVDTLVGEVVR